AHRRGAVYFLLAAVSQAAGAFPALHARKLQRSALAKRPDADRISAELSQLAPELHAALRDDPRPGDDGRPAVRAKDTIHVQMALAQRAVAAPDGAEARAGSIAGCADGLFEAADQHLHPRQERRSPEMTVLHVIAALDARFGGPGIALAGLAKAQRDAGMQVKVVSTWIEGDSPAA